MGNAIGIYNTEMTIDRVKDRGTRSYSASTYFKNSMDKPNFAVFLATQVMHTGFCVLPFTLIL